MIRKSNSIPYFIKQFGGKFYSYTLNIEIDDAKKLLNEGLEITEKQNEVIDGIISVCRSFIESQIDHIDTNYFLYLQLRANRSKDGTHMMNYLRTQCGGELPVIEHSGNLVNSLQLLGIQAYPTFLLRNETFINRSGLYDRNKFSEEINKLILSDEKLKQLFDVIGNSEIDTYCSFTNSVGRGGTVQLATFIDLVLSNSYYLMVLSGYDDVFNYVAKIEEVIELLREIAENKKATVPVFMGYTNISFPKNTNIRIPQGSLNSFNERFLSILPNTTRPGKLGGQFLAFVFQGDHLYSFKHSEKEEKTTWPKEYEEGRKKLDLLDENLKLSISLSIRRNPPISLENQWTIIFDPLSPGLNISYYSRKTTPTTYYLCSEKEINDVKNWLERINKTNDLKIRLAIRKLINSISKRSNPIDGFIDAIVTWENLFGANAELSFRISAAISCLIEPNKKKRKELYKRIKDAYNTRSAIVHGVKEIDYEKATELRDFATNIGLDCLSELYKNHSKLINEKDRALSILLEQE